MTPGGLAAVVLCGGVGLSLGLVGGGGSILAVPILVYVAGVPPREAVPLSLAVVGATSLVAAAAHALRGNLAPRALLLFGGAGIAGSLAGARLTPLVAPPLLLLLFSLLMLAAGAAMVSGAGRTESAPAAREPSVAAALGAGLVVGVLTGFLGVGGGFLSVPALVLFARLEIRRAIGTSLAVITLSAGAGLAAHLATATVDRLLAGAATASAVAGALAGTRLAARVSPGGLRRLFGVMVLAVGASVAIASARTLLCGAR